jgi:hypothetical protein
MPLDETNWFSITNLTAPGPGLGPYAQMAADSFAGEHIIPALPNNRLTRMAGEAAAAAAAGTLARPPTPGRPRGILKTLAPFAGHLLARGAQHAVSRGIGNQLHRGLQYGLEHGYDYLTAPIEPRTAMDDAVEQFGKRAEAAARPRIRFNNKATLRQPRYNAPATAAANNAENLIVNTLKNRNRMPNAPRLARNSEIRSGASAMNKSPKAPGPNYNEFSVPRGKGANPSNVVTVGKRARKMLENAGLSEESIRKHSINAQQNFAAEVLKSKRHETNKAVEYAQALNKMYVDPPEMTRPMNGTASSLLSPPRPMNGTASSLLRPQPEGPGLLGKAAMGAASLLFGIPQEEAVAAAGRSMSGIPATMHFLGKGGKTRRHKKSKSRARRHR